LTRINVKFSERELELLRSLASDQIFRREFIDSRLPGSSSNADDLVLAKQLVARIQSVMDRAKRDQPDKRPTPLRKLRAVAGSRDARGALSKVPPASR